MTQEPTQQAYSHQPLIIIDGGGTSCHAGLFVNGHCLGEVQTGPANVFVNAALAQHNIVAAVSQLCAQFDLGVSAIPVVAGCAGAGVPSAKACMHSWQHPFAKFHLLTDIELAAYGANRGEDCHMLVVGTGSCALTLLAQRIAYIGGHGHMLGDDASGAWLGQEALRYTLLHLDGLVPSSDLVEAILSTLALSQPAEIVAQFQHATSAQYAELAPLVFEHAGEDDMASHIVAQGIEYLVHVITHLTKQAGLPVFGYGSVWQAYAACDIDELQCVQKPHADPLHGGFWFAQRHGIGAA
jgi:glucosamine kinase